MSDRVEMKSLDYHPNSTIDKLYIVRYLLFCFCKHSVSSLVMGIMNLPAG